MQRNTSKSATILLSLAIVAAIGLSLVLSRKVQKTDTTAKRSSAAGCAMQVVIAPPATATVVPTATPTAIPATPTPTPTPTVAPTPTPTPIVLEKLHLRAKFAGVTQNVGTISATLTDGATLNGPLSFSFESAGVYGADFTLPQGYTLSNAITLSIKAEKHLQRVFRSLPVINKEVDLTARPFEPGDLPPQDGIVDLSDINSVVSILAKPSQSSNDRVVGDVNYDGVVNAADMSTILTTLSTHPDESL